MKASIIITSFNRSKLLSFGLESLAKQNFPMDKVEVIVLNDGNSNDGTEGVCELFNDELNIKYFAASKHKEKWRVPGFAINYGVRRCSGEIIFISCAEMYHLDKSVEKMIQAFDGGGKLLTIPFSAKDDDGSFLRQIQKGFEPSIDDYNKLMPLENVHLPFFMGMRRDEFVKIRGYDEDFIGFGFDDNDIVHRMKLMGNIHHRVDCRVVHLFHRRLAFGSPDVRKKLEYNQRLFAGRSRNPIRNNENWGNSF